jgi:hypothetical protein
MTWGGCQHVGLGWGHGLYSNLYHPIDKQLTKQLQATRHGVYSPKEDSMLTLFHLEKFIGVS